MDQTLKKVPVPQFMSDFFTAVDSLNTDGFRRVMAKDVIGVFGDQVFHGVDAYVKGFLAVDASVITKHHPVEIFQIGSAFVMSGNCDLTPKGDPKAATNNLAPLLNFFWLNDQGKIVRHVVSFAPEEKPGGYKS